MTGCHYIGEAAPSNKAECTCICHKPSGKVKCLLCNCRESTEINLLKDEIKSLKNDINKFHERLELTYFSCRNQLTYHQGQLDGQQERINGLEELIYEVKDQLRNSDIKPFKCPICDGFGSRSIDANTADGPREYYLKTDPCISCNGKGIVWN